MGGDKEGARWRAGGEQPEEKREIMTVGCKDRAVSLIFFVVIIS